MDKNKKTRNLKIFDYSIIIVTVALLLGLFMFFFRKSEMVKIRVKVTDQNVLNPRSMPHTWYANRFVVGDGERDTLGRSISKIINMEIFNVTEDKKAVYLDMEVKAVYDARSKTYTARGKQLVFGAPMRFNLSTITFDGFITEVPNDSYAQNLTTQYYIIETIGRYIEPKILSTIKQGDTIYNSNNILLAELLNIKILPAELVTENWLGEPLLKQDPLYKDIIMTLKIRTKKYQGEIFMFDDVPVKIGTQVPLNFPNISLFPIITGVSESP